MFVIKFYNDIGTITFGGGSAEGAWRLTACDGLALPGKSFTVCRYAGCDGQTTVSARKNARTITLTGDFYTGDGQIDAYAKAMTVLGESGTLEVGIGGKTRRTAAECASFTERGHEGAYRLFAVQFVCDNPYFESGEACEVLVYRTIPLLDGGFAFPGKFSERISRRIIVNSGDCAAEPTIFINAGHNPTGTIAIINHTSGEKLSLNYEPLADEVITIDTSLRKITGADGENLLNYLSDDSFFDGFHLMPGDNDIEVLIGNANRQLDVSCRFRPCYSEAVC